MRKKATQLNKKVLLRERKRQTTRRVASARFADVGGVPHPVLDRGGTPSSLGGGYPRVLPPDLGWGTTLSRKGCPPPDLGWSTPHPDLGQGTPRPGMGYPPRPGTGYPPLTQTWDGVPPPPPTNGEQTDIPKYKYYLPSYYVRGR